MNKFRSTLVAVALVLGMLGPSFLTGPLTNVASGLPARSVHSSSVIGKTARPVALYRSWPCPGGGTSDC